MVQPGGVPGGTSVLLYFFSVTTASFVAAWLANISHEPDHRTDLLCLGIALLAGALAWLAETICAARERRLAAKRLRLIEAATPLAQGVP